jgi:hypothetical protein
MRHPHHPPTGVAGRPAWRRALLGALALGSALAAPASAQQSASGAPDLAAAAQNPIASTMRFPLESSFLFDSGEDKETSYVGNFQPVLPMSISENWNLISRPIVPIMYLPGFVAGLPSNPGTPEGFDDTFGLGDINYSAFLSPKKSEGLIWGAGPSITVPSATDDVLGSGKWSIGPSVVALAIRKPWLGGVLLRQLWSFAGDSDRKDVNNTLIQPFLNYNLDGGWYLMTSPVFTANWSTSSGERWTVPLGGGVGKILKLGGKQPANMSLQAYYNVEKPTDAAQWQLQFTFMLMFPR